MSDQREILRELPPSAKLVYRVLDEADEPLTDQDIVEESLLPGRTVRYAVDRLESEGLITTRPNPHDARQDLHTPEEPGI